MKTCFLNQQQLPLVVDIGRGGTPDSNRIQTFFDLCRGERDFLHLQLRKYGALLLRNGPMALSASQFARFVREFSGKGLLDYTGGASPRVKLGDGVYTSTEYHRSVNLSLHNELSYTSRWPGHLFFYCVTPAERGGETPLADSRAVLRSIDRKTLREFKRKQIKYVRNLPGDAPTGYSWQEAFETEDRRAVEDYCRGHAIDFRWKEDGGLSLSEVRPATITHPLTSEEVWFNQADGFHPSALDEGTYSTLISTMEEEEFRLNACFGDGSPIELAALNHIREVMRAEAVSVSWHAGDILILDNILTAHGRTPFSGARRILLAMT
jgi:alpha-ketoglutarate-dependent taurine dioxygenase